MTKRPARRPNGTKSPSGPKLSSGTKLPGDTAWQRDIEAEWLDWYRLTPQQRWRESQKLREFFLAAGGSLDAEPDSQSPFDSLWAPRPLPADGRASVRLLRRGGI